MKHPVEIGILAKRYIGSNEGGTESIVEPKVDLIQTGMRGGWNKVRCCLWGFLDDSLQVHHE